MQNIESLIVETLKLFSEVIDIADGELRTDNGFFSQTLSNAWHSAEDKTEYLVMILTLCFGVFIAYCTKK